MTAERPGIPLPGSEPRSADEVDHEVPASLTERPAGTSPRNAADPDVLLLDGEQLKCLSSPTRMEIFGSFVRLGRASVAEVARSVGRPPDALYYHLRQLIAHGLVKPAGQRPATTRPEELFEPVAHLIRTDDRNDSPQYLDARKAFTGSLLRAARRRLHDRLDQLGREGAASSRRPRVHSLLVRLDPKDADEFLNRLEDAFAFARNRSRDRGGELYSLLGLATPVADRAD